MWNLQTLSTASTVIMNFHGLSLSTFWSLRPALKGIIQQSQDHYPEMSNRIIIVNAPRWMHTIVRGGTSAS